MLAERARIDSGLRIKGPRRADPAAMRERRQRICREMSRRSCVYLKGKDRTSIPGLSGLLVTLFCRSLPGCEIR